MRRKNTIKSIVLAGLIIAGAALTAGHGDDWASYSVEAPQVSVSLLDTPAAPEV